MADEQGFEVTLGDGTVVKGANIEEAFKSLAKMKEDTAAALRQEREQRTQYEQRLSAMEQAQREREFAAQRQVKPGEFDKNEYYRLLNEDPIAAQNFVDAHRFGLQDPSSVPGYFQRIDRTVTALDQQAATAAFIAQHPEFPGGDEAARMMREQVEALVNEGHPFSARTLGIAYNDLVGAGRIKPALEEEQREPPAPPSLSASGGGQVDTDLISKAEKMSDAELEKLLRQQGVLR